MIIAPRALLGALREVRGGTERRPVAIGGARELVPLLARELREGGDAAAVREGASAGAAVFVWIGKADEDALRAASLAHVPIVGVTDGESLPYVLDTDLVVVRPGKGLPVAGGRTRDRCRARRPRCGARSAAAGASGCRRRRADPLVCAEERVDRSGGLRPRGSTCRC